MMRALRIIFAAAVLLVGATAASARPWGYYPAYGAYFGPYYSAYTMPYAYGGYYSPYSYYSGYRYPGYYSSYYTPSYSYYTPYSSYYGGDAIPSYYYGW